MPSLLRMGRWPVVFAAIVVTWLPPHTAIAGCLPAVPTQPEGNYIVPGVRGGIVYSRIQGRELKLDAWIPSEPGGRPAVVIVHGGGYTTGSRIAFVGQFMELLGDAGVPWFSVEYRLTGPAARHDALEDVRNAIAFVRCHAGAFGIDARRLVLLGEDSGAQMALDLAREPASRIAGAILAGGSYASAPASRGTATAGAAARNRAGPQVLFIHGTADTEQPIHTVRALCDRVRASPAACALLPVEGAIHRAENWRPSQWGYKRGLIDWLKRLAADPSRGPWEGGLRAAPLPAGTLAPGLHKRIVWDADHALTLDAWLPGSDKPSAAVVLVHGGGWEAGDRVTYITPLFEPLARAGLAWISIDYRLTPAVRHPAQLEDLRRAVAFVRAHAPALNIDPARLVLVGESASGQMVTLLAAEGLPLAGAVSFYGVYDFEPMVTDASPPSLAARLFGRNVLDDETRGILRDYSPLHRARSGMAPVLLIHGTNERLWEQGVAMAARLRTLGVPHELLRLDDAPHGMENWEGHGEWEQYKLRLIEWIVIRNAEFGIRN